MSTREMLVDVMNDIDPAFISEHMNRSNGSVTRRITRYAVPVAIYAAACIAVMLILPHIIRHGNDPAPIPGDDPIVVETIVSGSETEITTEVPEEPELPMGITEFNGCEYTITLDKTYYTVNDTINATVVLENKGNETIGLYQGYLGCFLDEVVFYENGEERRTYSSDHGKGYSEAILTGLFIPGEKIVFNVQFTPGSPLDPSTAPADPNSDWTITAYLSYYTDPDTTSETVEPDYDNMKTASVSVTVPHDRDTPATVEVTTEPPETTVTTPEVTTPPPETTTTTAPPETTTTTAPPVVETEVTTMVEETTFVVTEEEITYPDPFISNQTTTSITKMIYGCEFTVSIDKEKYEPGDTVNVVVTLENKRNSNIKFKGYTLPSDIEFKVNGDEMSYLSYGGIGPLAYTLPSGEKRTAEYTYKTKDAKIAGVWTVETEIRIYINEKWYTETTVIEIPHDGIDPDAFSPIGMTNPFTGEIYLDEFGNSGEILIIMEHDTSVNWDEYINSEYLGLEIEKAEAWSTKEQIQKYVSTNSEYKAFVTIYLKDKSGEALIEATNKLYALDIENDFISYACPEFAKYH